MFINLRRMRELNIKKFDQKFENFCLRAKKLFFDKKNLMLLFVFVNQQNCFVLRRCVHVLLMIKNFEKFEIKIMKNEFCFI